MLKASAFAAVLMLTAPVQADTLKVFAAASLSDALDEALEVCRAETGADAIGVYAGSGTAARQVAQGAPASIYISANPQWMDWLEQRELIATDTRIDLLGNRLVLIENRMRLEADPEGSEDEPFAIADPETVPVGRYAKQALENTSKWPPQSSGVVYAGNAREVLAWVARGEARFGVVYASDAKSEARVEEVSLYGETAHDPIRYPAAVVADYDTPKARGLLTCLKGTKASDVFKQFGFNLLE